MPSKPMVLFYLVYLMINESTLRAAGGLMQFEDFRSCNTTLISELPPPLGPHESIQNRLFVDHVLEHYWKGASVYNAMAVERGIEYTYGEVTPLGVRQLVYKMRLQNESKNNVVFYDLGSGVGRLVAQIFLEHTEVINMITGIELSQERHSVAQKSWEAIVQERGDSLDRFHPAAAAKASRGVVRFVHQNALQVNFADATHIYIASLCFPEKVTEELTRIILQNAKQEGNKLKVVAALSDLRLLETEENQPWITKTRLEIQMTWGSARVRFYEFSFWQGMKNEMSS